MTPRVSILTSCYNDAQYLAESVGSSLRQTVRAIEVIIIDDGSTDHTPVVARCLAMTDARVTVVTLADNSGHAAALNAGAKIARAPWILKVDADDRIKPTYVEKILAVADAWEDVNCVFSPAACFGRESYVYRYPAYNPARMIDEFQIPGPAAFKRDLYDRVGGFDESMRSGEDWDFWVRASLVGLTPVQLSEPLWEYRLHTTPRVSDAGKARIKELKSHMRRHTRDSVLANARDAHLERTGAAWR